MIFFFFFIIWLWKKQKPYLLMQTSQVFFFLSQLSPPFRAQAAGFGLNGSVRKADCQISATEAGSFIGFLWGGPLCNNASHCAVKPDQPATELLRLVHRWRSDSVEPIIAGPMRGGKQQTLWRSSKLHGKLVYVDFFLFSRCSSLDLLKAWLSQFPQIGRLGLLVPLFTSTGALRGGCDDASGSVLVRAIAGVF